MLRNTWNLMTVGTWNQLTRKWKVNYNASRKTGETQSWTPTSYKWGHQGTINWMAPKYAILFLGAQSCLNASFQLSTSLHLAFRKGSASKSWQSQNNQQGWKMENSQIVHGDDIPWNKAWLDIGQQTSWHSFTPFWSFRSSSQRSTILKDSETQ